MTRSSAFDPKQIHVHLAPPGAHEIPADGNFRPGLVSIGAAA